MKRPQAHLSVNFGQKPFVFDIDGMVAVRVVIFCFDMDLLNHTSEISRVLETKSVQQTCPIYIHVSMKSLW